jgi:hypothetical protein
VSRLITDNSDPRVGRSRSETDALRRIFEAAGGEDVPVLRIVRRQTLLEYQHAVRLLAEVVEALSIGGEGANGVTHFAARIGLLDTLLAAADLVGNLAEFGLQIAVRFEQLGEVPVDPEVEGFGTITVDSADANPVEFDIAIETDP